MSINSDAASKFPATGVKVHEKTPKTPCYVTFYDVDLCYGGPEEGGWWWDRFTRATYDDGRTVAALGPYEEEEAYEVARYLNEAERDRRERDHEPSYTSTNGGEQVAAIVEDRIGENVTTHRPHYE